MNRGAGSGYRRPSTPERGAMRIEANCPTCNTLIESFEQEGGWTAHSPLGTRVGTGEAPSEVEGMTPTITGNPDFDVMTLEPCGHVLRGSEIHGLRFRKYAEIPEELELGTPGADMVKATPSGMEAGGVLLFAHDGTTGASPALNRADTVKLRDWLTKLLEETA